MSLALFISPATWSSWPDLCLFHRLTSLPCPTCGLTRSWAALLRGQVAASLRFHAFGAASLVLLLGGLGVAGLSRRPVAIPRALVISGCLVWVSYALGRMFGFIPGP